MPLLHHGETTVLITPSGEAKIVGIGSSDRRSDGKPSGMTTESCPALQMPNILNTAELKRNMVGMKIPRITELDQKQQYH